ncbi:MAG: 23S rRNA (adenine(2503)-C(2))-methyltransferase RlmN [Planctomycetota bacterium]
MSRLSFYNLPAIESLRRELRLDPHDLRKARTALLKRFASDREMIGALPEDRRRRFLQRVRLHALTLDRRCDSQHDGATKLLFRTDAAMLIETVVLRVASGRTALCVSSQVGCAAACDFCATGKMGVAHNLTADEIVDQVVQAGQLLRAENRRVRNIVFMGMGEPFHNEQELYDALQRIQAPEFFHHAPSKILVSTVGLPDAMLRCARRFERVNLALSLHSVRQEVRERLIPLARRYPLDEIRAAVMQLNAIQPAATRVMVEYLMVAGVNDSADDARELIEWLAGLRAHVNLIPYNSIDDAPHLSGTDRAGRDAFAALLKQRNIPTTIRYSLGSDIAAACGQLVRHENRRRRQVAERSLRELPIADL